MMQVSHIPNPGFANRACHPQIQIGALTDGVCINSVLLGYASAAFHEWLN